MMASALVVIPAVADAAAKRASAVTPLVASSCDPLVYEGAGTPDVLIVSDLPMQGASRPSTSQMTRAITDVLRQRSFTAGAYKVGYQACDDSTAEAAAWDSAQCQANATAYAGNPQLLGIIGKYSSGCAKIILPVVNAAAGGPIAMISPSNTYQGMTRSGPGTDLGEPAKYYPTGVRNYVRVTAGDRLQAAANAKWTKLKKRSRVFVLTDGTLYGNGQAADYRFAARKLGITVAGFKRWNATAPTYGGLAKQIKASRAGAVYLAGILNNNGGQLVRDLRTVLGPKVLLIAPDGFTPVELLQPAAGTTANGLYVSVAGHAPSLLPPAGRRFVADFKVTEGDVGIDTYAPYAAQSAQILLDAIAASDGTRRSVVDRMFATNVVDGIMGSFGFDAKGDPTPAAITIYQITKGRQRPVAIVRAGLGLIRRD